MVGDVSREVGVDEVAGSSDVSVAVVVDDKLSVDSMIVDCKVVSSRVVIVGNVTCVVSVVDKDGAVEVESAGVVAGAVVDVGNVVVVVVDVLVVDVVVVVVVVVMICSQRSP